MAGREMPRVTVVRTYLELSSPVSLRSTTFDDPHLQLARSADGAVDVFRALYREVGANHQWHDRDRMSDDELRAYLQSPDVQLWVLRERGDPAGFFELRRHRDASVEITYFGLVPRFIGRGLGKHLLSRAAEAAWAMGATRVWVHTCTLDAPSALPNYLARGFEPIRTETYEALIPADQDGGT